MLKQFLFGTEADMVERGLILAAIVATAMAAWTIWEQTSRPRWKRLGRPSNSDAKDSDSRSNISFSAPDRGGHG